MDRIEGLLNELLDAQTSISYFIGTGQNNDAVKSADHRAALRQQIADEWRAKDEALERFKTLLGPDGDYAICRADGSRCWLGDDLIVGGAFEKADSALRGEPR